MALIGNRSVIAKSPGRFLSGTSVSNLRNAFGKHGMARNSFQALDPCSSTPAGARPPISWVMAKTSGGMASHNDCSVSFSAAGDGALGVGLEGASNITFDATAFGGLIAGGVGSAAISITGSGAITATIGAPGTASITIGSVGNVGALGWIVGQSDMDLTAALVSYAKGHMSGTTAEAGLTPTGIANAIGARIIEAGFSFDEILRILAAQAAGSATGLESSNPQFIGLDGETVRIDGTYVGGSRTIDSLNGS